jgi:hypothetical protein
MARFNKSITSADAVNPNAQAGKGDDPRHCFSDKYRRNYDAIDWGHKSFIGDSVVDHHHQRREKTETSHINEARPQGEANRHRPPPPGKKSLF